MSLCYRYKESWSSCLNCTRVHFFCLLVCFSMPQVKNKKTKNIRTMATCHYYVWKSFITHPHLHFINGLDGCFFIYVYVFNSGHTIKVQEFRCKTVPPRCLSIKWSWLLQCSMYRSHTWFPLILHSEVSWSWLQVEACWNQQVYSLHLS